MNKQTLITLAVIVGLLALWLLIAVLYPAATDLDAPGDDTDVEQVDDQATSGQSATVTATVRIVGSAEEVAQENEAAELDAKVTIE